MRFDWDLYLCVAQMKVVRQRMDGSGVIQPMIISAGQLNKPILSELIASKQTVDLTADDTASSNGNYSITVVVSVDISILYLFIWALILSVLIITQILAHV